MKQPVYRNVLYRLDVIQRCRRTGIIRSVISFDSKYRKAALELVDENYHSKCSNFCIEVADKYIPQKTVLFYDDTGVLVCRRRAKSVTLPKQFALVRYNRDLCIISVAEKKIVQTYPTIECYQRRTDAKYLLPK